MSRLIGKPLPRLEDLRLLTGHGRYSDDLVPAGAAHAVVVRSPYGHARIRGIDIAGAQASAGVLGVFSAADYLADGRRGMAHVANPIDAIDITTKTFPPGDGHVAVEIPQLPLAMDRVRHVGDPVAFVVAETLAAAKDAADLVMVDYEPLEAVTEAVDALVAGAPLLYDEAPGNLAVSGEQGDRAATKAAFARAAHVVEGRFLANRVANAQMEPRAATGDYDAPSGTFVLDAGSQGVSRLQAVLADALAVPKEQVRVISRDVGGGFGPRNFLHAEFVLCVWAAKQIGRPVHWASERTEAFLSDVQGRDMVMTAALALDETGKFLALRVENVGNVGAHAVSYVPMGNHSRLATTTYAIPAAHVAVRGAFTNTLPTGPYRGAGRPEAVFVIERLIDMAADELGIDRTELRRRNLIASEAMPYRTAVGLTYDSGAFADNMARVLEIADWQGFPARRAAAQTRGRLAGIGLANYVEAPVGAPHERAEITVKGDGVVEVVIGTQSTGQGHETSFAQVVAETLGVDIAAVRFVTGDSARVTSGGGTHSDRSMRLGGTVMVEAGGKIIAEGRTVAAALLQAAPDEVSFEDGRFTVPGSDRSVGLFEVAAALESGALPDRAERALKAEAAFTGRIPAFPNGAAVCEVEVDPETGRVAIVRYSQIDDVGRVVNPLIIHGQVHGGIVQGVGQVLIENCVYEPGSGQVQSGSFMDYGILRADEVPSFAVETSELAPTRGNPLGIKGGGEGGTTPALATVTNAVVDALREHGVRHLNLPLTPERVWRAIHNAPNR